MAKYIVGGVIVVLAWVLAIFIQFTYWIPTLITLVVALVLLLLFGLGKLRERRAARELEKALSAQAAHQAATARPDLQHEIAEMNAEFHKAVSALKTSKKGGKKALYSLPWYAIIGPPGSGKSTALRNSGLEFPYLSASGGGVRGLGGTRNCDWWMTSEAVILDTAGRWTTETDDHDEWLAFLDLTKRFRPKKPLNGIIAAVSVGDLGNAREEETVQLARRVRERIDEVQGRLSLSLPVYVLFTKCDLIPGFVESFGEMSKQDRGQVWGFTAPLSKPIGPSGQYFSKGFDELLGVLEQRTLKRMGEERKIASREMVYAFPQQVAVLKQNLHDFVHALFQENVFKETPRLRGVYFTSGTQEGRPIDRVMSRMAEAFGQPQVQLPAPQVEAKSYFLRDMFSNIVFKDAAVAVRSPEEVKRQRRNTYLAAAGIFLFAVGISGLPAISWARNRSFLNDTRDIIDAAREATAGESQEPLAPEAIEPLRQRVAELEDYHRTTSPVGMGMGMYRDVFGVTRDAYLDILKRRVVEPIVNADVTEMDSFGGRYEAGARPDPQELRAMYNRLKLHLLLTTPRDANEPPTDDELREFTASQLASRWQQATEMRRSDARYPLLGENVRYYVRSLADHEDLYLPRNPTTVARVRGVFNAESSFDMAVAGIVEEVRPHGADMTLARLLGREVTMLRARERVRFAFTRDGWDRYVRRMLETDAARFFGEPWVLGHPPPENERVAEQERECQVAALRSHFLNAYAAEWRRFIDSLEYQVPHTDQEGLVLVSQLTSGDPMRITMLVRQIDREVTLDEANRGGGNNAAATEAERAARNAVIKRAGRLGPGGAQRILDAAGNDLRRRVGGSCPPLPNELSPAGVRDRFLGFLDFAPVVPRQTDGQPAQVTPARKYEEQLEFLRDALRFRIDGTNVTDYDQTRTTARGVRDQLIGERPPEWQPVFHHLLDVPVEGPQPLPPPDAPPVPPQQVVPPPVPAAPAPAPSPAPRPHARPQRPALVPQIVPLGRAR